MLDADSVFERLLREAANLVPKMSTPKLTNALKVTSTLQQRITETVASRLQSEKGDMHLGDQQFSVEYVFPPKCVQDPMTLNSADSTDHGASGKQGLNNYNTVTVLPQLNHLTNSRTLPDASVTSENPGVSGPYATGTTLLSPITATVVSSGSAVLTPSACTGTILVPLSAGSAPSSVAPLIHYSPASSHSPSMDQTNTSSAAGTITTSTSITVPGSTAHVGETISVTGTNSSASVSYTISSTEDNVAGGGTGSTGNLIGCNGQKSTMDYGEPGSDHNGQAIGTDETVEMKPEPLEARTPLSMNNLDACMTGAGGNGGPMTVSTPTELASLTFNQLPPLLPFVQHSSSPATGTMVSPVVKISNTRASGATTVNLDGTGTNEIASSASSKSNSGSGPYRCRDCDKEFRILRYLEKHRRIHTGEKPYQCCYCGRQFNDWPNMNRHKRIHTGERPYRCSVCTKTFSQPAVYNEHVKRHTGERPYICVVCTKGFPRAARLAVHMRVHTGERPYACTSCERRFSQPHHLAAHLRVHSGDRPYSCPKCDVSFACISNLRRHRKQVHPSSPIPVSDGNDRTETAVVTLDEKKPTLPRLAVGAASEAGGSTVNLDSTATAAASSLLSSSSIGTGAGTDGPPVALAAAAAMSGTLLAATGTALVPTNLLSTSTSGIPSLILTSGPPGATILAAAPAHFPDQHSQLQPTLIATSNADSLRQTAVTFIASTGDLDRSCAGLTTLTTAGPEGGVLLNSPSGETVYLEPLDPRVAFESGQPFTLTTIPTSNHPHGATTTILGPSYAGAQILGHPLQIQPGQHGTHIAFTTSLAAHPPQLLAPNTPVFSANTTATSSNPGQGTVYANQSPATVIFPPPSAGTVVSSGASGATTLTSSRGSNAQPQSVLHASVTSQPNATGSMSTPTQLLHYHRSTSNSRNASPGRPSSTPTQHQMGVSQSTTTMLVPILTTLTSNSAVTGGSNSEPGGCENMSATVSCSPASLSSTAASSSSLGPITVTASVNDTNL